MKKRHGILSRILTCSLAVALTVTTVPQSVVFADEMNTEILMENSGDGLVGEYSDAAEGFEILNEEELFEDNSIIIENDEDEDVLDTDTENDISENNNTSDVNVAEADKKARLADTATYIANAVEGKDYVTSQVFRMTDSLEEVEAISNAYGAEVVSYENGIAIFKLPDTLSVAEAIRLASETNNEYPAVYPNIISKSSMISDISDGSNDDINQKDGIEGPDSYISSLFDEPYLRENAMWNGLNCFQWHHEAIGSPYAWVNGITGNGIKVAVLSPGLKRSHSDIDGVYDSYIVNQYGSIYQGSSDVDTAGYGTASVGLIAGRKNGSLGMGVAYNASIISYQTDKNVANAIKAIKHAADKGYDIIELTDEFDMPIDELEAAVNYAYAKGTAIFAPAGSTGGTYEMWPSGYKNVISVGAVDKNYQRDGHYSTNKEVDISVPGVYLWTCDASDINNYNAYKGMSITAAVAAGEAALILEQANNKKIKEFLDSNGNVKTGSAKVDALVKVMKSSTIKTGAGTGSGVVYIPKALNLITSSTVPGEPAIEKISLTGTTLKVKISMPDSIISGIVYSTNGKKPSYKDGVLGVDSVWENGHQTTFDIDIKDMTADSVTISAMAVSPYGIVGKCKTVKIPLTDYVYSLSIDGPDSVMPGKSIPMTAKVIPSNSKTKQVVWHVSFNNDENLAKNNGVSIGSNGVLKADKNAQSGTYKVWAVTKVGNVSSAMQDVTVNTAQRITSIKSASSKATEYLDVAPKACDLLSLFNIVKTDGTPAVAGDIFFTSSNPKIVSVTGGTASILDAGKVTITAIANDGSGIKCSSTLTVIQKVQTLNVSASYKVAIGKSITLNSEILPANSAVKKVTNWSVDANGVNNGIKVKNGKFSTTKNTMAGIYVVTAEIKEADGSTKSAVCNVEVIPQTITKLSAPKNIQIFRCKNAFLCPNSQAIKVAFDGGDRDGNNKVIPESVKVDISNDRLLTCTNIEALTDGLNLTLTSTGAGTGKVKVSIVAEDGSGKKAVCNVSIVNPVSTVLIGTSKTATNAVTAGKSIALKATIGQEYGKISNKKVEWSIIGGSGSSYAEITSSGVIKTKADAPNKSEVVVQAIAKDGSGASGDFYVTVYRKPGKLSLANPDGTVYTMPKAISKAETGYDFYVKVPRVDGAYPKYGFGDFKISSSNPDTVTARHNKLAANAVIADPKGEYDLYFFEVIGLKKGSSKITISTLDDSQKISFNMKVLQNK